MNTEEPSDWDSMSDPATEDQPSSFEISRQQDVNRTKQEVTASSRVQEINDSPVRDLQRPKSAYKRTIDSENVIAQKQRINEGIRNQSFDMSDGNKARKDSYPKMEKKEYGTPLSNKHMSGVIGDGKSNTTKLASTVGSPNSQATIVKSGTIPNFENVENHNGKGNIFGSGDPINQRSAFAFNTGQNHTGVTQKKVGYNQEVNVYGYSGDGVDNLGFDEIPFSVHEGYENEMGSTRDDLRTPQNISYPRADETIKLLRFEEPSSRYFQIMEDKEGIYADKISTKLVRCFDKGLTEGFGILKIPFVIIILGIAHLILFFVRAIIKPLVEFLIKPLLVSCYNLGFSPLCGFCYNITLGFSNCIYPCCKVISVLCACCKNENISNNYPRGSTIPHMPSIYREKISDYRDEMDEELYLEKRLENHDFRMKRHYEKDVG